MKSKILTICIISVIALAGCKHADFDDDWQKISLEGGYSYYLYQTPNVQQDDADMFVTFPGFGGGYDDVIRQPLKKYLQRSGKNGTIVVPRTEYQDPAASLYFSEMTKNVIETIGHRRLFLLGCSAGGVKTLSFSNEVFADKLVPIVAGAYAKAGGQPTDQLPTPAAASIWFLNGYDPEVLAKYGILWDGTVFVDPAKNLAESIDAKITLAPGLNHETTVKLLSVNDEVFDWLTE